MLPNDTRIKIENIVSGNGIEGAADHCTAIRNILCRSFATSQSVKTDFESKSIAKKEQAKLIADYAGHYELWAPEPNPDHYLTRGGEASVYLHSDGRHVLKLNDAIYYATWLEFFNSILLHNLIFTNTAYDLIGFVLKNNELHALLQQPFIISDSPVDLDDVRKFLGGNGFENTRRNDYIHRPLGLILEDIHDENVIVNSETLFFIDSVFYTITAERTQ